MLCVGCGCERYTVLQTNEMSKSNSLVILILRQLDCEDNNAICVQCDVLNHQYYGNYELMFQLNQMFTIAKIAIRDNYISRNVEFIQLFTI